MADIFSETRGFELVFQIFTTVIGWLYRRVSDLVDK
jgi:biotin transporter BioY